MFASVPYVHNKITVRQRRNRGKNIIKKREKHLEKLTIKKFCSTLTIFGVKRDPLKTEVSISAQEERNLAANKIRRNSRENPLSSGTSRVHVWIADIDYIFFARWTLVCPESDHQLSFRCCKQSACVLCQHRIRSNVKRTNKLWQFSLSQNCVHNQSIAYSASVCVFCVRVYCSKCN